MQEKLPKHPKIHKTSSNFPIFTNQINTQSLKPTQKSPDLAGCVPDLCLDTLVLEMMPDIGGGQTEG